MDFSGRVAIVTGGGKGVGRAIAEGLAARGASVVVNNRSRDGTDSAGHVAAEIEKAGGRAVAERSSVEAPGAPDALVATALESYGRLDLVVANAAVVDRATFVNADLDEFRRVMEIDFMAPVALAKAALTEVRSQSGRFLFVTSAAGAYGEYGVASYAAAKGALGAFAKTLALELARDDVKVNLLAPFAATQMTEGFVDETTEASLAPSLVVPAALWLLSSEVTVTGSTIVAAANRFRSMVTGETAGVSFAGHTTVSDEAFLSAVGGVIAPDDWQAFSDGMSAFQHLMQNPGSRPIVGDGDGLG